MKYLLERMLREIALDEQQQKTDPKQKLSRDQIRDRVKQRKREQPAPPGQPQQQEPKKP